MCSAVRCSTCGKATWEGCGQHIEEALSVSQRIRNVCARAITIDQHGFPVNSGDQIRKILA